MLQHLLVMAGCSAFHMKHPEYDAENLDRGIVFDGKTALVNRGHPVVSLFDAWCEQRGKIPIPISCSVRFKCTSCCCSCGGG